MSRWLTRGLAAACVALVAAVYLLGLDAPLNDSDEAIYAEFIAEMHRSGDYGTLRYQGVELVQRPPTAVALYALVARAVPGELGLRLAPALLTWLAAVAVGLVIWWRGGGLAAGVFGLLFCAGIPSVFFYGRLVFSDQPLVLLCLGAVVATWAAQRDLRWLPWAAMCLGAGFAVKSLAAAIPLVALAPWLGRAAWRHRAAARSGRRIVAAIAGFLALAAPYYVYGFAVYGRRFYDEHIGRILVDRASGGLESVVGIGGPLAYAEHLVDADGAAGVLIALSLPVGAWLAWRRRDELLAVAVTYAAVVLIALSAAGTRLAHYLLVFYPTAALCLGLIVAEAIRVATARAGGSRLGKLVIAGFAPAVGLAVFALAIAAPPIDPAMAPSPAARAVGLDARAHARGDEPVYTYDWYAPAVGVYAGRPWRLLSSVEAITGALQNSAPFRYVGNVEGVPPWPAGELLVAGDASQLSGSTDIILVERLAEYGPWLLARVRAVDSRPMQPR